MHERTGIGENGGVGDDKILSDRAAVCILVLLVLGVFSLNLVTGTYPVDPFWVEIAQTHMPISTFYSRSYSEGFFPLWDPHLGMGHPPTAHSHSFPFYPLAACFGLADFIPAMTCLIIIQLLLLGLTTYWFLRSWGSRPAGSLAGSASMSIGGYAFVMAGQLPVFFTYVWTPLIFLIVSSLLREVRLRWVLGIGVVTALQSFAGDFEMMFYQWLFIMFFIGLSVLFGVDRRPRLWSRRSHACGHAAGVIVAITMALIIGGVLSSVQLIPLMELISQSDRTAGLPLVSLKGKILWAMGEYFMWLMRFLSRMLVLHHYYNFGFVAVAFGIFGWWKSDRRLRLMILILFSTCFISSVPFFSPLQRVLSVFPVLSSFRFPWRMFFLLQFMVCVAAALGVDRFLRSISNHAVGVTRLPAWLPLGLSTYGLLHLRIAFIDNRSAIELAAALALVLSGSVIYFTRSTFRAHGTFIAIIIILMVDLLIPSLQSLPRSPADIMAPYPEVERIFRKNESGPEAFSRSIIYAHRRDARFHTGMEAAWKGYSPGYPCSIFTRRYSRFMKLMVPGAFDFDEASDRLLKIYPFYLFFLKRDLIDVEALPWYDLIGLRYMMVSGDNLKSAVERTGHFDRIIEGEIDIFLNSSAYPRTFLVTDARVVENSREAFRFMKEHPTHDYLDTAVLESAGRDLKALPPFPEDVRPVPVIRRYIPNIVEIDVDTPTPAYLVLTDSYYPGWRASIDGVEAPVIPAYGNFRAAMTRGGARRITFIFKPVAFRIGLWTTISSGLLALCLGISVARRKDT